MGRQFPTFPHTIPLHSELLRTLMGWRCLETSERRDAPNGSWVPGSGNGHWGRGGDKDRTFILGYFHTPEWEQLKGRVCVCARAHSCVCVLGYEQLRDARGRRGCWVGMTVSPGDTGQCLEMCLVVKTGGEWHLQCTGWCHPETNHSA